jgi:hypothetical protein
MVFRQQRRHRWRRTGTASAANATIGNVVGSNVNVVYF